MARAIFPTTRNAEIFPETASTAQKRSIQRLSDCPTGTQHVTYKKKKKSEEEKVQTLTDILATSKTRRHKRGKI
jgi:hypothetical protein